MVLNPLEIIFRAVVCNLIVILSVTCYFELQALIFEHRLHSKALSNILDDYSPYANYIHSYDMRYASDKYAQDPTSENNL